MGAISSKHRAFDLIYNPEETFFLKEMRERGAKTKNGLEMLQAQAEESWKIWSNIKGTSIGYEPYYQAMAIQRLGN